jgi:rod shape-determining protein MreB and related proteins
MAGGSSQLHGLTDRLQDELKIRVWLAEDPVTCVARGAGLILEDYDHLKRLLVGLERGSTVH